MTNYFFGDTAVLSDAPLRHITRSLDTIITTTIMPIGSCCSSSTCSAARSSQGRVQYVNYLLPGTSSIITGILVHRGHLATDRIQALPGYEERHLRAISVHADRAVVRVVGAVLDIGGRAM